MGAEEEEEEDGVVEVVAQVIHPPNAFTMSANVATDDEEARREAYRARLLAKEKKPSSPTPTPTPTPAAAAAPDDEEARREAYRARLMAKEKGGARSPSTTTTTTTLPLFLYAETVPVALLERFVKQQEANSRTKTHLVLINDDDNNNNNGEKDNIRDELAALFRTPEFYKVLDAFVESTEGAHTPQDIDRLIFSMVGQLQSRSVTTVEAAMEGLVDMLNRMALSEPDVGQGRGQGGNADDHGDEAFHTLCQMKELLGALKG